MITEGAGGRIFEVTPKHEIVWEYVNPYKGGQHNMNMVYRAYRLPYDWIPQLLKPEERALPKLDIKRFRVPGSPRRRAVKAVKVKSGQTIYEGQFCVTPTTDIQNG